MTGAAGTNHVRAGLAARRFVLTIEVATPNASVAFEQAVRPLLALAREIRDDPRIDAVALTDRSRSDHDHDPILTGHRMADQSGKMPIVHWAGKDRSLPRLDADMRRAEALGLDTFLLVTGDKVRQQPIDRPVRYLDSVNALAAVRQRSQEFLLAAAVSPFKYREEELVNQYLKALKKLRAGADLLMTQIGWDPRKYDELRRFLHGRGYRAPVMAEVLLLTPARGRRIRRFGLPGVTITDDLAQRLEEAAAAADGGRTFAFRLLALQITSLRDQGFAGAQVSGIAAYPNILRLLDEIESVSHEYPTHDARQQGYRELLALRDGRPAQVAPAAGLYLNASEGADRSDGPGATGAHAAEWARYRVMASIDHLLFAEGAIGARALAPVLRRLDARSGAGNLLLHVERAIKEPLVGCQACGFCRLPETTYVCPETCPKGLANGPCGGTRDNVCEFGDRECIHNQIYRISKRAGLLSHLEEVVIPPVPEVSWGSCSWVTHFQGEGPRVARLPMRDTSASMDGDGGTEITGDRAATLEEVIARIPALAGARVVTEPIGGGITNINYRVEVDGASFFVRIPGKESRLLGIDRRREYECTLAASQSGVGPEVVHFLEAEGILVTRFIAGRGLSVDEIRRPDAIRRVASSLRRLHDGPAFPGTFSPLQAAQDYLRISRPGAPLPPAIDSMVASAQIIDEAMRAVPRPRRPCHNDLLLANFIDDGRLIRIVDWEYAAMGDPFFDLGNFAVHQGLSDEQETALLEAYLGQCLAQDLARLKLMKILSDLREATWAMVQVSISTLDYDFVEYGRKHFDRYAGQLEDPRLPGWLTDAVREA